jgi:hypothetical protein
MKKATGKSPHKTALVSGRYGVARHPMTKISKEAPPKSKVNPARKGTAKSRKAG